ncbi:hypothetical protein TALC_00111 [Thermoplasmatales archaeon BRNA1]|nr:hypothetical protein TALC_00111 [Thermoplasmatales archaeon BRNA1]
MSRTDIVVIAHGKSEMILAKSMRRALRLPIEVFNPFNGEHDIAIGNILEVMEEYGFHDDLSLHKMFDGLQYSPKGRPPMKNLAVFPILDIDAYRKEKKAYSTGNMFRDSAFADRIHPIFNDTDLDTVLQSLGYDISTGGAVKTTSYHNVFDSMTAEGYLQLSEQLKTVPENSNMHIFIDFCLSQRPEYQGKVESPF